MVLLPAIDLLDGKVVRLAQGKRDQVTVYSDDPVSVAMRWAASGATWLHVVDLNGAFDGTYSNLAVAEQVIKACGISVELSGGIRTEETLSRAIGLGAARVVLGTKACEDPAFVESAAKRFGKQIAVAMDANAGKVVSRGWVTSTNLTPAMLTADMAKRGVQTVICTDVSRDGMMQGPNLSLLREVAEAAPVDVIASGGISSLEDLKQLKTLKDLRVVGAIVGKALYEGAIDAAGAVRLLREP